MMYVAAISSLVEILESSVFLAQLAAVLIRLLIFFQKGQKVLIAAHGNSIRALVKYLDNMTDEAIMALNIPTGEQLSIEFDTIEKFALETAFSIQSPQNNFIILKKME